MRRNQHVVRADGGAPLLERDADGRVEALDIRFERPDGIAPTAIKTCRSRTARVSRSCAS